VDTDLIKGGGALRLTKSGGALTQQPWASRPLLKPPREPPPLCGAVSLYVPFEPR